jgi:hypothetical protein
MATAATDRLMLPLCLLIFGLNSIYIPASRSRL